MATALCSTLADRVGQQHGQRRTSTATSAPAICCSAAPLGRHRPKKLNVHETGPTSNLLLTVAQMMGVDMDSIGDSTRALEV